MRKIKNYIGRLVEKKVIIHLELCKMVNEGLLSDEVLESVSTTEATLEYIDLMEKDGYRSSLKKHATHYVVVGEKQTGCFILGRAKIHWLVKI